MSSSKKDYRYVKILFLQAGKASAGPPLGTILGNVGVNTNNFCTQFNNLTLNLPDYFLLRVNIFVYDNKSISFNVNFLTTSYILNLLKFELITKVKVSGKTQEKKILCVKLYAIIQLAKLKFPQLLLKNSLSIILGTVKSSNISIIR